MFVYRQCCRHVTRRISQAVTSSQGAPTYCRSHEPEMATGVEQVLPVSRRLCVGPLKGERSFCWHHGHQRVVVAGLESGISWRRCRWSLSALWPTCGHSILIILAVSLTCQSFAAAADIDEMNRPISSLIQQGTCRALVNQSDVIDLTKLQRTTYFQLTLE